MNISTVIGGPREVYFSHLVPIVATNAENKEHADKGI